MLSGKNGEKKNISSFSINNLARQSIMESTQKKIKQKSDKITQLQKILKQKDKDIKQQRNFIQDLHKKLN